MSTVAPSIQDIRYFCPPKHWFPRGDLCFVLFCFAQRHVVCLPIIYSKILTSQWIEEMKTP